MNRDSVQIGRALGQNHPAAVNQQRADQVVGAWRLLTVETIKADGSVIYPFYGKHPEGF